MAERLWVVPETASPPAFWKGQNDQGMWDAFSGVADEPEEAAMQRPDCFSPVFYYENGSFRRYVHSNKAVSIYMWQCHRKKFK